MFIRILAIKNGSKCVYFRMAKDINHCIEVFRYIITIKKIDEDSFIKAFVYDNEYKLVGELNYNGSFIKGSVTALD